MEMQQLRVILVPLERCPCQGSLNALNVCQALPMWTATQQRLVSNAWLVTTVLQERHLAAHAPLEQTITMQTHPRHAYPMRVNVLLPN